MIPLPFSFIDLKIGFSKSSLYAKLLNSPSASTTVIKYAVLFEQFTFLIVTTALYSVSDTPLLLTIVSLTHP